MKHVLEHDDRPWDEYFVLDDANTRKVKQIVVNPGSRLSCQYYKKRSEVWTVVSEVAMIIFVGEITNHKPSEVIKIPQKTKHRIQNRGNEPFIYNRE